MRRLLIPGLVLGGPLIGCPDDGDVRWLVSDVPPLATDVSFQGETGSAPDPGVAPQDLPQPVDPGPPPPDEGPEPEVEDPPQTITVTSFPFHHEGDTSASGATELDAYSCKPGADESGPEHVFRVEVPTAGFLSAAVYAADGVDVDVHILADLDPEDCLDRGDKQARADVAAGTSWVVVDTWVTDGTPLAGEYALDIGFVAPSVGPCGMLSGVMKRVGDGGDHLPMPATGPIVLEAHLVTQEEPPPYPSTSIDELQDHYALSQTETGFVMHRGQVWAPLEGGDFYGAGIGSPSLFPVEDEGWYVNMYWTKESRPDRGTRMILREPGTDRAVVVAAGYETGPGNLDHIGGTPEETHFYLGSEHLTPLQLGIAVDQAMPLGPRTCTEDVSAGRYPAGQVHSPMTESVIQHMQWIAGTDPLSQQDVFMKVGASGTVSSHHLECFDGPNVDLAGNTDLQPTLDYYLGGDAAGKSPYKRKTLAAKVGVSANWAIAGDPSPIEQEMEAIAPRIGIVNYGLNDMQMGTSFQSAVWGYGDNLLTLVDELVDAGVVPVVVGLTQRTDVGDPKDWVKTYTAVARGIAQARQVPFLDLGLATADLPGFGLTGDGLHLNAMYAGGARPCVFTADGLEFGYNMRNLVTLEALDRVRAALEDTTPVQAPLVTAGQGSPDEPFVIDGFPFTDLRDTTASAWSNLDTYTGCDADQDESGPEYLYRLEISEPTTVRAMVFDRGGVDIDIHLLDESATEAGCVERDHRIIEADLAPGTRYLALDTFVSGSSVLSGEYMLVVTKL